MGFEPWSLYIPQSAVKRTKITEVSSTIKTFSKVDPSSPSSLSPHPPHPQTSHSPPPRFVHVLTLVHEIIKARTYDDYADQM